MPRASAPGKVILFGEHAVVYGEPAIAAAIDLRTSVRVSPSSGATTVNRAPLSDHQHAHIAEAIRALGVEGPLAVETSGTIPSAAGLGSSAALSVATCAAILRLRGEPAEEGIARAAYDVEWTVQGGRGSPTDTTTSVHGNAVLVAREMGPGHLWTVDRGERRWFLRHIDVPDLRLVVGNTGIRGRTSDQVAKVARFVARTGFAKDVLREIGALSREAEKALAAKDAEKAGRLMDRNHNLLSILGVSTPELDRLCNAARPSSLGAKLTGSGGGGSMIALTERPEVTAEAIRKAGGSPHVVALGGPGVRAEAEESA